MQTSHQKTDLQQLKTKQSRYLELVQIKKRMSFQVRPLSVLLIFKRNDLLMKI